MNCNEASEFLAAAVLGDLDRDGQRAVHTHLAGCDRCLDEERELFQTMHLLQACGDAEPGPHLHQQVMTRARQTGWLSRTLLTAAATALLVLGLQTMFEPARPGPVSLSPASLTAPPSPALLEGTLFDRQRNLPEDVKRFKQQRHGGDTLQPLYL